MQFKAILLSLVFSTVVASAPLAPKSDVELIETHEGPHDSNLARRADEGVLERRQEDHSTHHHHHHHAKAQKKNKLARRHEGPHDGLARRALKRRQSSSVGHGLTRRSSTHEGPHDGLARRSLPHEGPHDGLARRALKRRQNSSVGHGLARRSSTHEGPHDGLARRSPPHEGPHDGLARRAINHRDRRSITPKTLTKRGPSKQHLNRRLLGAGILNSEQEIGKEGQGKAPDAGVEGQKIMDNVVRNVDMK